MTGEKSNIRQGGCVCGCARYEIDISDQKTSNCHCMDCRRHIGAAFSTFTMVPIDQFRWLKEPTGEIALSDVALRRFCNKCGTYLKWDGSKQANYAEINTSTFDEITGLIPTFEIYTNNRLEWVQPVRGAIQYDYGSDEIIN